MEMSSESNGTKGVRRKITKSILSGTSGIQTKKSINMKNPLIHGYLTEEIVKICEDGQIKIKEIRLKTDRPIPPQEMFADAELLQSFRTWITSPLLEADARFRDKVEAFRTEGMSVSAAETRAKVTPEYRAWQYLKRVDGLIDDQIMLVKKFEGRLNDEYQAGSKFQT